LKIKCVKEIKFKTFQKYYVIMTKNTKKYHTGSVTKAIMIKASKEKIWKKISNIVELSSWVVDVKKTTYLSKKRRNVGAIRKILFDDGNTIEEHIIAWKEGEYFTYLATEGLPLRAYVATLSIIPKNKNLSQLTWHSYLNSKKMSKGEFTNFVSFLEEFYKESLGNLKKIIEVSTKQ